VSGILIDWPGSQPLPGSTHLAVQAPGREQNHKDKGSPKHHMLSFDKDI
jgi:hypothetical protein